MDTESIGGILLMLIGAFGMGADLCFQYVRSRIITGAKLTSVFIFYLGALLYAPVAVALFPIGDVGHWVAVIMYGATAAIAGLAVTLVASLLWFGFYTGFVKFEEWYRELVTSDPCP